jgi:hypothetical protein
VSAAAPSEGGRAVSVRMHDGPAGLRGPGKF